MLAEIGLRFQVEDMSTLSPQYIAALHDRTAFIAHPCKKKMTFQEAKTHVEEAIDLEEEKEEEFSIYPSNKGDI